MAWNNFGRSTVRLMATVFLAGIVFAADRPARGVARISLIHGDVSVRRGDSGEWVAAAVNAPLVVQDRLLTGPGSRAEVQMDYANMVRLASNAEVRFSELEYGRYLLQLASGMVTYRVLRDSNAEVEISTPSVSVRPARKGAYRISVLPDGTTQITVRSGEAEIYTPRGSERLRPGKTMIARGASTDTEFQVTSAIARDDWDQWNERRDRDLGRSSSYRYVSSSIYGVEDLDDYGRWVYDPPYGWVWVPRVAPGWAPYRYGRWSWIDWYGWSWVSYDPWGWAPFHYGRWYWGLRGWCWWPGAIGVRHFWSPGLVAWVGFGGAGGLSAGIGLGWGSVGWIPLAPFEPYYPGYGWGWYRGWGGGGGYVDNSGNIVNNVNVTNVYRNSRVRNGLTAIDARDFVNGRVDNIVRLNDSDVQRAFLIRGQLPLAPEQRSQRLVDREISPPARSADNDRFFSRRSPSPVERVSFDDQRRGVEELSRRMFGDREARGREQAGDRRGAEAGSESLRQAPVPLRNAEPQGRGWRRANETVASPADRGSDGPVRQAAEGWRRFGEPRGRELDQSNGPGDTERLESNSPSSDRGGWRRFGDRESGGSPVSPELDSGRGFRLDNQRGSEPRANASGGSAVTEPGSRGANERNPDRGWRRFGEPRGRELDRSNGPGDSGRLESNSPNGDRGGWRRFGDRESGGWRVSPEPDSGRGFRLDTRRGSEPRANGSGGSAVAEPGSRGLNERNPDSGWRRFGEPGSSSWERDGGVFQRSPRMEVPRSERPADGMEGPEGLRMERRAPESGTESLRFDPPILRDRWRQPEADSGWRRAPQPEAGAPRPERWSPVFERSAPRFESSPRFERSAPRMEISVPRMESAPSPRLESGPRGGYRGVRRQDGRRNASFLARFWTRRRDRTRWRKPWRP